MGGKILFDLSSLNQMQLDAIREIGNIGAGHAATAISEMLGCTVEIDIPKAELVSIYNLDSYYDDPRAGYAAVFASSDNDKPFNFMFLIREADVSKIVSMLVAKQFGMEMDASSMPQDMVESALGETGNILLGSFLNSVNGLLGISSGITTPSVTHDTLASILSVVSAMFGQYGDIALVTKTQLNVMPAGQTQGQSESIDANILMASEPDALEMLLMKLGVI
ncbi:MAG: chemotaxis protein CheC [Synergistaceae bacterium]|jgi:chemotaxis protein CheC|nr:chemotaxis protein CheC [Synergistaceae bacterium]